MDDRVEDPHRRAPDVKAEELDRIAAFGAAAAPDLLVVVDPAGVIRFTSDAAERVLGMSAHSQLGTSMWDHLHPDDLLAATGALNEARRSAGYHHPAIFRVRHADGGWVECEANGTTVDQDDGSWLVLSLRPGGDRDEVIGRRRQIEQIIRRSSLECSSVPWPDADAVVSGLLGDLAGVVGAVLVELAWSTSPDTGDGMRVGLRWPGAPGDRGPGRRFEPLWDHSTEPLMHFCADLDELPPSAEAEWLRRSGHSAVVEVALTAGSPGAVLRLALGAEWHRWDDLNVDLVTVLATTLMGTMRRCEAQAELSRQARTDALTGLVNRGELYRRLDDLVERRRERSAGRRHRDGWVGELGVLYCDLDRFKQVNDRNGHAAGDAVLVELSEELRRSVREVDLVSRVGGDEFVVVCPELESDAALDDVVGRIRRRVATIEVDGRPLRLSVGAVLAADGLSSDDLIRLADEAMYRDKSLGEHHEPRG